MKHATIIAALILTLAIPAATAVRADVVTDQSRISVSVPQEPNLEGRPYTPPRAGPLT